MPIPAVTEEPVAVTEEPELVAHQAPPTSCGLVRFLKRRIGFRGVGRTRFVQTPPGLKEPMGGGLDGWLAGLDAEDPAKQALRFPVNLPLPANLSPPRRSSPSRLRRAARRPAHIGPESRPPGDYAIQARTLSSRDALAVPGLGLCASVRASRLAAMGGTRPERDAKHWRPTIYAK